MNIRQLSKDGEENNDILIDYYEKHQYYHQDSQQKNLISSIPINQNLLETFDSVEQALSSYTELKLHQMIHPTPLHEIISLLGPSIFILWKSILLKQRILLMNKCPPMEKLCYFVYQLYLMGNGTLPLDYNGRKMKPMFNISINDITELENTEDGYIACTSDNIFDIKKDLYDVLIKMPSDNTTSSFNLEITSLFIKTNRADYDRFNILCQLLKRDPLHRPLLRNISNNNYPHWTSSLRYQITHDWYASQSVLDFTNMLCCGGGGINKNHRSIHLVDTSTDSTKTPLLLNSNTINGQDNSDNDMDTQELQNNRTTSEEYNNKHNALSNASISPNLLGFFHVLTYQLLSQIQFIIDRHELFDQEDTNITFIKIEEMIQLGLDPWEDRYFLQQLGQLYFNKKMDVSYLFKNESFPCCYNTHTESSSDSPIQL